MQTYHETSNQSMLTVRYRADFA